MLASKSGSCAEASAAPRANASSGWSGEFTGSAIASPSDSARSETSVSSPNRNTPSGAFSLPLSGLTRLANTPEVTPVISGSLARPTIEPSAESTTASVAVCGSITNSADLSYPVTLLAALARAPPACSAEKNSTPSIPRLARESRSSAASAWSLHTTPVDTRLWPPSSIPSRVPTIADSTCSEVVPSPSETTMVSVSTILPSAPAPSTSTRRAVVGVIETPSTTSTSDPPLHIDTVTRTNAPRPSKSSSHCRLCIGLARFRVTPARG
ncbi:Uncharacterised protein [Mycobacteroides abscessus subsp. massiliense]|nr:Uncharacterised protein [Mycobacteroides abscessus]SKJ16005.1 Uncharacterised protein [Mycobacteroides abscessus subsp. massiliense]SKK97569.1 Uncharacterised protein [Mycobacteroides abscessus subsp. massiliense]